MHYIYSLTDTIFKEYYYTGKQSSLKKKWGEAILLSSNPETLNIYIYKKR